MKVKILCNCFEVTEYFVDFVHNNGYIHRNCILTQLYCRLACPLEATETHSQASGVLYLNSLNCYLIFE